MLKLSGSKKQLSLPPYFLPVFWFWNPPTTLPTPHHRRRHAPFSPPTRSLEQLVLLWLRLRLLSLFNHQSCSLVCVCCLILLISAAQTTCRPIARRTPLTATRPLGRSGRRPLTPWPPRATTRPPTTSTPKPRLVPAPWRRARSRSLPLRPRP